MDHTDLFNAVARNMCTRCEVKLECHPTAGEHGLNFDAVVACLKTSETILLPQRPRGLGQHTFAFKDLLGREVNGRLEASLIDETARGLKDEGVPIDLSSADWTARVMITQEGYVVQIWDREVHFP